MKKVLLPQCGIPLSTLSDTVLVWKLPWACSATLFITYPEFFYFCSFRLLCSLPAKVFWLRISTPWPTDSRLKKRSKKGVREKDETRESLNADWLFPINSLHFGCEQPDAICSINYYKGVTHSPILTNTSLEKSLCIKTLLCCDVLTVLVKM